MFPSPNHGPRRSGQLRPSLIILHYTAMVSAAAARERLCDPAAEVSAHWLVSEQGAVEALVPEDARAWHAGRSHWRGVDDINSASIGIELANRGDHPFPEPQMRALETLLSQVMARWQIPASGVLAHSDIAPDRKIDPGARFDWPRLARQGLAAPSGWPLPPILPRPALSPSGAAVGALEAQFAALAQQIGYGPQEAPENVLRAFRLRHAPWRQGQLCAEDLAQMQAVAQFCR